jgi:hypothetical protein
MGGMHLASGCGGSIVGSARMRPDAASFQLIRASIHRHHLYTHDIFLMKKLFARALCGAWVLDADFCQNCEARFASKL